MGDICAALMVNAYAMPLLVQSLEELCLGLPSRVAARRTCAFAARSYELHRKEYGDTDIFNAAVLELRYRHPTVRDSGRFQWVHRLQAAVYVRIVCSWRVRPTFKSGTLSGALRDYDTRDM